MEVTSMGDYTIFKAPRFCPQAQAVGSDKCSVSVGDLILYEERYEDGTSGSRLGRVLGLANRCPDGSEHKDMLVVLAADDMLSFAYERFIKLGDVLRVRAPSQSAFTRWLLSGPVPRPEVAIAAVRYGCVNERYIDEHLQDGELKASFRDVHKVRLTAKEAKALKPGDTVYWIDPDAGRCSRTYFIKTVEVEDGVAVIEEPNGSVLECPVGELADSFPRTPGARAAVIRAEEP
jgi:hypothetical protein